MYMKKLKQNLKFLIIVTLIHLFLGIFAFGLVFSVGFGPGDQRTLIQEAIGNFGFMFFEILIQPIRLFEYISKRMDYSIPNDTFSNLILYIGNSIFHAIFILTFYHIGNRLVKHYRI